MKIPPDIRKRIELAVDSLQLGREQCLLSIESLFSDYADSLAKADPEEKKTADALQKAINAK